jgi:hypothetical protein
MYGVIGGNEPYVKCIKYLNISPKETKIQEIKEYRPTYTNKTIITGYFFKYDNDKYLFFEAIPNKTNKIMTKIQNTKIELEVDVDKKQLIFEDKDEKRAVVNLDKSGDYDGITSEEISKIDGYSIDEIIKQ